MGEKGNLVNQEALCAIRPKLLTPKAVGCWETGKAGVESEN